MTGIFNSSDLESWKHKKLYQQWQNFPINEDLGLKLKYPIDSKIKMSVELRRLLTTLDNFLTNEYKLDKEKHDQFKTASREEKIKSGKIIIDLTLQKAIQGNKVILRYRTNNSKFKVGDTVELKVETASNEFTPVIGSNIVTIVNESYIDKTIVIENDNAIIDNDLSNLFAISSREPYDNSKILKSFFRCLCVQPQAQEKLLSIWYSDKVKTSKYNKSSVVYESRLNEKQKEALSIATGNFDKVFLIQGPPGTGKTTVISHIVNYLYKKRNKILVTAFTHTAIDNALYKIRNEFPYIENIYKCS